MSSSLRPPVAALALLSLCAHAADPETVLPVQTVSADKIETAAQLAHQERQAAPNPRTVIEAEQLNQFGDQPLGDALRRLVGISFDGANRAREIQLRTLGTEYTQVTINGRRILDGNSSRGVQVDRIPSSLVERIEIIHTPLASQDAQGAAGTVNIVLKQNAVSQPNEIGVGLGSLQGNGLVGDASLFYGLGDERLRLTLSGGVQQQRRNESKDALVYTAAGDKDSGTLNTNERRYEQVNLVPRLEARIDGQSRVLVEPTYLQTTEFRDDIKRTLGDDQSSVTKTEQEYRKRTRENAGLYAAFTRQATAQTQWTAALDLQHGREDTTRDAATLDANGTTTGTRQRTQDTTLGLQKLSVAAHTQVWGLPVEAGAGHAQETRDARNTDIKNGKAQTPSISGQYGVREQISHVYGQTTFSPWVGNQVTLGLRAEQSQTRTEDFDGNVSRQSGIEWLPSVTMKQSLQTQTDWRLGLAQTLRRPSLADLSPSVVEDDGTYAAPDTAGNPALQPEKITGLDVAIDRYFADRKGLLSAKAFVRHFSDKIETLYASEAGRIVARPQNSGTGRMQGLELDARLPLEAVGLQHLTVWGNLTAVHTQLTSRQTGEKRRFLDQPDQVANLGLDLYVPALNATIGTSLNHSSGYYQKYALADGTTQINDVEARYRLDLSVRTQLNKNTSLNLSALNLLAGTERRVDETLDAAGVSTGITRTAEPTYRSVYMRLVHQF